MSDTKTPGDKTLHVPKTLSLPKRPAEQSTVRQSFSHGRSNTVVVETVKRRQGPAAPIKEAPVARPAAPARPAVSVPRASAAPEPAKAPSASPAPAARPRGIVLQTLTDQEREARRNVLSDVVREEEERRRLAEDRRVAEEASRQRAEREAREAVEREAAELRKRDEDERRRQEDDRKRRSEEEARRRLGEAQARPQPAPSGSAPTPVPPPATPTASPAKLRTLDAHRRPMNLDMLGRRPAPAPEQKPAAATAKPAAGAAARPAATAARPAGRGTPAMEDESDRKVVIRRPGMPTKVITPPKRGGGGERRGGRLTIASATSGEDERTRSVASYRRRMQRMTGRGYQEEKEKLAREVVIPETITVQELASRMAERAVDVIKLLMKQGQMMKITDVIDSDTAQLIAEELGHTVKRVAESDVEEGLYETDYDDSETETRPPVVTIMGHVDHGKTSLLDAVRKTDVVRGEAGGITQHIGAYQVRSPLGGLITFIDTPGHAAFSSMRARGAKVTDIVVLVVAADDGVKPQTIEAISHAKAAEVPLIVAINKIDKPGADPQRVRTELLQHDIQVESMGGETLEFEVSALKGTGLKELLEGIQLQAELLDLRADPEASAEGTVIEAKLDRGRGPVATVLIQRGTLYNGEIVVAGAEWGRVRALISDDGESQRDAPPSTPVEILGFNGTPEAGDRLAVVESEARAREIVDYRARVKRERLAARAAGQRASMAELMRERQEGSARKDYALVLKGDVQGSVEAITAALEKIGNEEVSARILHAGVGAITESDVTLAQATGALIIGFNVRAHKEAREAADQAGVNVRYYNIIYDLVDDVRESMSSLLPPNLREERLGEAKILEVFDVSKIGKVAGCRVEDGRVERGAHVRLIRDGVVIHEGKLSTLKRYKDDVKEVVAGQDCGMSFENYERIQAGDFIECYLVHAEKRTL
ncbi:translation initiation factor IF-2 [Enterovirga rhinocerotis]|uniref:Translation initiation factor IF-2 n=1 Tax=Enterovirga rhinocerotis TaxID=1339210 RepID=A0A4V3DX26_9HYPH|nr:translation initiation factor IF-2 [Enterovirga rhinocerotis]TDR87079.1 translation initiation factor 2 (bIF-2) [Enterovirga rhinocerotis]